MHSQLLIQVVKTTCPYVVMIQLVLTRVGNTWLKIPAESFDTIGYN